MTILLACGLTREARLLAQDGIVVVAGGGDEIRLEHDLERHCSPVQAAAKNDAAAAPATLPPRLRGGTVRLVISCGLAGALDPSLQPGDIVISATGVPERLMHVLHEALPDARTGTIVGADTAAASVEQKRQLHHSTGAAAVDMESPVAIRVAARHGLPFVAIRVISDDARTALPPAALVGMKPDGGMALGAVLASLARAPRQLPALIRTGIDAERAFRTLRRVHDALAGVRIALTDLGEFRLDM